MRGGAAAIIADRLVTCAVPVLPGACQHDLTIRALQHRARKKGVAYERDIRFGLPVPSASDSERVWISIACGKSSASGARDRFPRL